VTVCCWREVMSMTNVLALQALPGDVEELLYVGRSTTGVTSSCSTAWMGTGWCAA
jgi:hypothetical protein